MIEVIDSYQDFLPSREGSRLFLSRDGKAITRDESATAAGDAARSALAGASSAAGLPRPHAVPSSKIDPVRVLGFGNLLLMESTKTANTENTLETGESHEMLRSDPPSTASGFARDQENPIPGGRPARRSQVGLESRAEKPEKPKIARAPNPAIEMMSSPSVPLATAGPSHVADHGWGRATPAARSCGVSKKTRHSGGAYAALSGAPPAVSLPYAMALLARARANRANRANLKDRGEMGIGSQS